MRDSKVLPMRLNPFALTIPDFWKNRVPRYESKNYGAMVIDLVWDPKYAQAIKQISPKRAANRRANYIDPTEMDRVEDKLKTRKEASIRFGVGKEGYGYNGERGDFCLVGGVIKGRNLALFYRSLELIGGFAYDLTLIDSMSERLGVPFKIVTIYTCKAFTFALKGNSNEKLFPKLQVLFSR